MSRLARITSDPSICHGKPTLRGLRHPIEDLLDLLASDMTMDEVLADHPELERDDLMAALEYAALVVGGRRTSSGLTLRRRSIDRAAGGRASMEAGRKRPTVHSS
jgi:uncharacterized protein (DUF433 family)